MKRIQLILGTINSQPLGERDVSIESVYQKAYRPTLKTLYRYPQLKFTQYYSGTLLDWLEVHHSEYLSALSEMVQQRHVELLLAGYYDPVLPLIPRPDRVGQIEQMTTHLRKLFGRRPRGAWITEQIWENDTASSLKTSGVEYAFLDDYHFAKAGFEARDFHVPCITEDQNKSLVVFPVSNYFRQKFWVDDPANIVNELIELASDNLNRVVSLLIDGETASPNWPLEREEEERGAWLSEFLRLIAEKQQQRIIETLLPSRYMRRPADRSRGYFPATIWDEMRIWNHGEDSWKVFRSRTQSPTPGLGRLGYFFGKEIRQSMARYPESNGLFCKMQYVHSLVNQVRGDKYRKNAAREELWKGQSNTAYWHGARGGIYRNHLRKAAYTALLKAEKHTREKGIFAPSLFVLDYDLDGIQEVLYQGNEINAYVHVRGGTMFELDYMLHSCNYLDTMARYPEAYHGAEQESEGYDTAPRRAFVDRFFDPGVSMNDYARNNFTDRSDMASIAYRIDDMKRDLHSLRLSAEANVGGASGGQLAIKKSYSFSKAQVSVEYLISNFGSTVVDTVFASEVNLSFSSADVQDLRVYRKEGRARGEEIGPDIRELPLGQEVYFEDLLNRAVVHCQVSQSTEWWNIPVYSYHSDDERAGREKLVKTYQGSCLVPRWHLRLEPGHAFQVTVVLNITRLVNR